MRWTERQRAMLRAMGIELFEREAVAASPPSAAGAEAAGVEAPAQRAAVAVAASKTVAPSPAPDAVEADWLLVGEPIDDEADPTGAQAQLLDNMLRAIAASRTASARSGRAVFLGIDAGGRAQLEHALAAARPRCVVALGRGAAQAMLGSDEPLGALRGRRHERGGVAVVATCSLAFLLRHPEEKARAWADLCLAVRAADAAPA